MKKFVVSIVAVSLATQLYLSTNVNEGEKKEILMIRHLEQQDKVEELRKEKKRIQMEMERTKMLEIERQLFLQKQLEENHDKFKETVMKSNVLEIDLRQPSGITPEKAEIALEGTLLSGLGKTFVEAENLYGVNAYYLMSHAAWESEWGKSNLTQKKNNLFGFQAYDATPFESAKKFESKEESILIVAEYLKREYLNPNGEYYNGSNLLGVNKKYATDKDWSKGIGSIMKKFVKKVDEKEV